MCLHFYIEVILYRFLMCVTLTWMVEVDFLFDGNVSLNERDFGTFRTFLYIFLSKILILSEIYNGLD